MARSKWIKRNGWLAKRRCTKATTSEQLDGGERKKREERSFADILGSLEHNTYWLCTRARTVVKFGSVLVGIKVRKPVVCMYTEGLERGLSHPVLLLPVYFLLRFSAGCTYNQVHLAAENRASEPTCFYVPPRDRRQHVVQGADLIEVVVRNLDEYFSIER